MAKAMFIIDYDNNETGESGYLHICADNAQDAVNQFEECMGEEPYRIDGVYKEVQTWKQRRKV